MLLNLAMTAATRAGLRVGKRVYGVDWGGLLKSSVEESEVPDGEESSESRLLHSLQMRERERVQKKKVEGLDPVKKLPVQSNIFLFFFP